MDPFLILALILVGVFAGIIGAIFGLGGGIIFMPFLTIVFGMNAGDAVAVSLIGIIASSVGAASVYVEKGTSNIRLGLLLEITAVIGAVIGAVIAGFLADWMVLCMFSAMLTYSALHMALKKEHTAPASGKGMRFTYADDKGEEKEYGADNVGKGMAVCTVGGIVSSTTGVGGGTINVPLMNALMHVPIKVSTATSSYMIGITAFAGAIVYLLRGNVVLEFAAGIAIGSFIGALLGTMISKKMTSGSVRASMAILLFAVAAIELLKAGGLI